MQNLILRKLVVLVIVFLCVVAIASGLVNTVPQPSAQDSKAMLNDVSMPSINTGDWRNVVKRISEYQPKITEAELAAQEAAEKERLAQLAQQKELSLNDAKLVGTVLTSPAKALLVLPDGTEPIELRIGESWLAPWALKAVSADYIVWQHAEAEQVQQQALFQ